MEVFCALVALVGGVAGLLVARWWLLAGSVAALAAGSLIARTLPRHAAWEGVNAVAFVCGMVFVAAATERSGLLGWLADGLSRRLRRPRLLLAATFLLAVAITTTCNLDTTAVLFTPLAISIAEAAALDVVPFAVATVLAANFGSMLLPTSNLTNLVLWRASSQSFVRFAALSAPAAALAVGLSLAVLLARPVAPHRPARHRTPAAVVDPAAEGALRDVPLAMVSGGGLLALVVAFLIGLPAPPLALAAGLALVLWRPALRSSRLSGRLMATLLVVFAASGLLSGELRIAAHLDGVTPWQLAWLGAAIAAVGTNLAAVLLLEPAATSAALRLGLLIGVDLGVGLTPVASLATVLWADALRRRGRSVPWRRYLLVAVPLSAVFLAAGPLLARG